MVIKVLFDNDDYIITRINCSFDEARKYYLGNIFNLGSVEDNLVKAIDVQLLNE